MTRPSVLTWPLCETVYPNTLGTKENIWPQLRLSPPHNATPSNATQPNLPLICSSVFKGLAVNYY